MTTPRSGGVEAVARRIWARWIRPRVSRPIARQRLQLVLWGVWGYRALLSLSTLTLRDRLGLLFRCLRVDWNVLVAHKPAEFAVVCRAIAERRAKPGEIVLEAGCWRGGSSAKFSLVCSLLGYRLWIYDSFQGVEALTAEDLAGGYDFGGEYAAPESLVRENLARYGAPEVCTLHKGWFADTLAAHPPGRPVRVTYIDCDLAKGTREALSGSVPCLSADGWIFSQDYHLRPVRELLHAPETWEALGVRAPHVEHEGYDLASLRFRGGRSPESSPD